MSRFNLLRGALVCSSLWIISPVGLNAQTTDNAPAIDKRIFGVLPNYRTADGTAPFAPITARHKFYIATKDSFDYPVYITAAAFAGYYQLENENPSFGQSMKGYAKRLASSYGDQASVI